MDVSLSRGWENKVLILFSATEQADIAFGRHDSSFAKKTILLSLIGVKLVPIVRTQRPPGRRFDGDLSGSYRL